jgi:hypothetical protein
MQIYIISVPSSYKQCKKRLSKLYKKLCLANLNNFKIKVIGVDGKKIKNQNLIELDGEFKHGHLKYLPGAQGCALSHIEVYKDIQRNKIEDDILILEDDATIHKNFLYIIKKRLPIDYDLFFLNFIDDRNYSNKDNLYYCKNVKKILAKQTIGVVASHAYILNGRNIDKIIKNTIPFTKEVDAHLFLNRQLNCFAYNSKLKLSDQCDISLRLKIEEKYRKKEAHFYKINNPIDLNAEVNIIVKSHASLVKGIFPLEKRLSLCIADKTTEQVFLFKEFTVDYQEDENEFCKVVFPIPKRITNFIKYYTHHDYEVYFFRSTHLNKKIFSIKSKILFKI